MPSITPFSDIFPMPAPFLEKSSCRFGAMSRPNQTKATYNSLLYHPSSFSHLHLPDKFPSRPPVHSHWRTHPLTLGKSVARTLPYEKTDRPRVDFKKCFSDFLVQIITDGVSLHLEKNGDFLRRQRGIQIFQVRFGRILLHITHDGFFQHVSPSPIDSSISHAVIISHPRRKHQF